MDQITRAHFYNACSKLQREHQKACDAAIAMKGKKEDSGNYSFNLGKACAFTEALRVIQAELG